MNQFSQKIAEARNVYETYWESYLNGNIDSFASTLDERYELIGTSESEIAHSKSEGLSVLEAQMPEVVGNLEKRDRQVTSEAIGDLILINELCDIYFRNEKVWNFYSKLRISTLLRETKEGWKVVQQHGSLPDHRVEGDETIALEKISKENLELRDVVRRYTAELENKNQKLAIEAALEKVRAVAMGMKKPEDMLDVCHVISDQLQDFGVERIRNVQIAMIDENIGQYLCYQYFTPYNKTAVEKTEYLKSPVEHGMVRKMLASRDGHFIGSITGKELKEFRTHRKEENHFSDPFLDKATRLAYCFLSIGEGGLGLTLYQPMADDVLTLFKRFHQVFSLAYQRFRDIQKAEAQAREAQIEAALERVRAQTMAMHSSEDVGKCILKMFSELTALGVDEGTRFGIGILNHENDNNQLWTARKNGDEVNMHIGNLHMSWHPLLKSALKAWKAQVPLHQYVLEGEDLVHYYQMINNAPDYKLRIDLEKLPEREFHYGFVFDHGFFYAFNPREFQPELIRITKRFSSLFEQTYRRYLDLVKAEAQAREAQIEAALERVRSSAMAMHTSEGLLEVIHVLREQMAGLGEKELESIVIHVYNDKKEEFEAWYSYRHTNDPNGKIIHGNVLAHWTKTERACKDKEKYYSAETDYSIVADYKMLKEWYEYLEKVVPEVLEYDETGKILIPDALYYNYSKFSGGAMLLITNKEASDDSKHLLKRSAEVFNLAYTRFLDLQKAEAQAREAQIETALEKVRSRSLAMNKSDELQEVITTVLHRLNELGIAMDSAVVCLPSEEKKEIGIWIASKDYMYSEGFRVPFGLKSIIGKDIENVCSGENEYFAKQYTKEEKDAYYTDIFEHSDFRHISQARKDFLMSGSWYGLSAAVSKNSAIFTISYSGKILNEAEIEVLKRFSRVFEQAYIRFLDLKKAEQQAREAQIEAALEKVRSSSLAMQSSDQIREIVKVVFEKLKELQFAIDGGVFVGTIADNSDYLNFWIGDDHEEYPGSFKIPNYDAPPITDVWDAKKSGVEFVSKTYSFQEKNIWFEYAFNHTDFKNALPEDFKKWILEQEYLTQSFAMQKNSLIGVHFHHAKTLTENEIDILKRFSRVFEQSYVRFVDLQKAEANAREAQIEAGLERFRSRMLGMHKSSELEETTTVMYQLMNALGIVPEGAMVYIVMIDKKTDTAHQWIVSDNSLVIPPEGELRVPMNEHPQLIKTYEAWKRKEPLMIRDISGEEMEDFRNYFGSLPAFQQVKSEIDQWPERLVWSEASFSHGTLGLIYVTQLPKATLDILMRFSRVFDLTYIRFLDIQKAEAQAREAQIEAALEKVRNRSLAMYKSEELKEVVSIVFEKLRELNVSMDSACILTFWENGKGHTAWAANPDLIDVNSTSIPYFDHPIEKVIYDARDNGKGFIAESWPIEIKNSYWEHLFEHSDYKYLPDELKQAIFDFEGWGFTGPVTKNTATLLVSYSEKLLSEQEIDVIKRFGNVFEQAYVRFLDLQKAEAQARESQIQLALERVRARTMAMQHSDELMETSELMFEQIKNLGIELWSCGFSLWCDDDSYFLGYNPGPDGKMGNPLKIPLTEDIFFTTIREAKRRGDEFFVFESEGESLVETYRYMDSLPVVGETMRGFVEEGFPLPIYQVTHCGFFLNGHLMFITQEPNSEAVDIFKRFTKVFNQAYTRFLDLQKAEAQAREAQIEAALERVRSRSMAMHKSDELLEAGEILFLEMKKLGIESLTAGYVLIDKEGKNGLNYTPHPGTKKIMPVPVIIPHSETSHMQQVVENWKKGIPFFIVEMDEDETIKHQTFIAERSTNFPLTAAQLIAISPAKLLLHNFYFKEGYVLIVGGTKLSAEQTDIMLRFAKVFQQTYTRFLDLQKAEAQAREAQIEAVLERVRSRTIAMQKSEDLNQAASDMFKQIQVLGMHPWGCGFNIFDKDEKAVTQYMSLGDGGISPPFRTPLTEDPFFINIYDGRQRKDELLVMESSGESLAKTYRYMFGLPGSGEIFGDLENSGFEMPKYQITHCAYFSQGYLVFITYEQVPEALDIFRRFAKIFEQTYTRFLDLQKAEAQAREAQIEAALEKVRSRTMAMRGSEELLDVASILFQQVKALGVPQWNCGFNIWEIGDTEFIYYPGAPDGIISQSPCKISLTEHPVFQRFDESRKRGDDLLIYEKQGEEQVDHYQYMLSLPGVGDLLKSMLDAGFEFPTFQIDHVANFAYGNLIFITYEHFPEMHDVFKRFAKVFEQTYTRFLDLQKAEAQAKEAKIEAALEKVRSRTMGMQSSEELPEVANLLFLEIQALGIPAWSCGYNILAEDKKTATCWMSSEGTLQKPFTLRLWGEASFDEMGDFLRCEKTMLVQELGDQAIDEHYTHMKSFPDLKPTFDQIDALGLSLPTYQINHLCKFTQGFLLFITYEKVPESHDIFKRFSKVFDQTYTRFLDLKKAEAQAREAQIENALEKVRSRSLAMQSPDELIEVAQLLREEMGALGVEELETSSIYIHDENNGTTQCWFTIKNIDDPGRAVTDQMTIDLQETWVGRKMYEFYRSSEKQTSILMQGEQRIEWILYCEKKSELFGISNFYGVTIPDRTYHLYKFSNGYIGAAAPGDISKESWELLKRATAVFSFAYTRFRDLQMAEASARAAMRQASLDRVRADISSMRHADDLDRITPLVFNELTTMGIPFIRCGVFIVHEKKKNVEIYLSTPEGKSLAVMTLPFDGNEMTARSVEAWKKEEVYIQHWDQADFINWSKSLQEQGHVKDQKTYQGAASAPESLHLHFIPFTQGLLYVGSPGTLAEEQIDLVKALAKAFSIAYARYEDFVKLELAKADIESTLSELKSTQTQLIQQEKLASLGQLTAGIAHEIKNPLNFVNNFSEVSIEMIEEALEELAKPHLAGGQDQEARPASPAGRDKRLIKDNLEDIKSNLQKIHEHGTRANGIVTSMLQHSRGGSGKKEPTDLNALIKEYVNLCFHGMRAGKNPINVDIVLDLDPELIGVSLIKEDFTRVVINLCNNAFDAMREKVKRYHVPSTKYFPQLTIRSKSDNGKVLIEIEDNGPGIPDEIKDKILQPFFTTKKGTEGTGLGLSITHDIVKAHGGELKVETKEGEGSEFIIKLPIV